MPERNTPADITIEFEMVATGTDEDVQEEQKKAIAFIKETWGSARIVATSIRRR